MGILQVAESPKVWVAVPGYPDFALEIQYLSPAEIKKVSKRCSRQELNKQTRQYEENVDNELLAKELTRAMILNWRGLTVEYLIDMVNPSAETIGEIESEHGGELPFSESDLATLVEHTYTRSFMDLVMEVAMDLHRMREYEKIQLEKNSDASPTT